MKAFGIEEWRGWHQQGYTRLPAIRVERGASLPGSWENLTEAVATVLLESGQSGRYSFVCGAPERVIIGRADHAEIWNADCTFRSELRTGSPLMVLSSLLKEIKVPKLDGWPAMTGGLMGVLGYDVVRTWERLPQIAKRDLPIPLYAMIEPRELYLYDHDERTLGIVVWCDVTRDPSALDEIFRRGEALSAQAWERWTNSNRLAKHGEERRSSDAEPLNTAAASFTAEEFQAAVCRVKEYIAAGDTYQVNLSLRTGRNIEVPAEKIYESLRRVNPSPYMGFLRLPEFALVCGSPELLVRLVGGVVSSRPIAGTRRRGAAAEQDAQLSTELLASEKERAEHLMLVDLIRNDIGRVAEFGSVHVKEFMGLERYSHVIHIVSEVEGRLASGQAWADVFRSMFPGGTITGCPKIRTMEIVDELEPVGRGFYTGAMGWISYAGEMEMNIVIRSMLIQHEVGYVQSGAGIVADSQPERELDEALRKAEALWVALEQATTPHGQRSIR